MLISPVRDELLLAGNLTLHYVQWGEQGSPIVCLHGLTANAFCFQTLAEHLAPDHRVFAYDLRGRGDSEKPTRGYNVPLHATDLANFLDAAGLERPVVIGHSLGALIALYFAAHYPEKLSKLVLIDAGGPLPWKTPEEQPAWLTASISRLGQPTPSFEEYIARLKLVPFLGPYWNQYVDLYFTHDVLHNDDGSVTAKAYREGVIEESLHLDEARPEQQWSSIQVPTLLLRAGQGLFSDNDQLLPEETAQAIRQGIVDCQYVNFPNLNHYTIIFGIEDGPVLQIRKFVGKE